MNNVRKQGMKYGLVIGCGSEYHESTPEMSWLNLDVDPAVKADIRLPLHRIHERCVGFFDEIEAKDIMEHVPYSENNQTQWLDTLQSWSWSLVRGGTLRVQVPDIEAIMKQFHDGTIDFKTVNRVIFAENDSEWNRHYQVFTLKQVRQAMTDMGLEITEAFNRHVCAIVVGRKP